MALRAVRDDAGEWPRIAEATISESDGDVFPLEQTCSSWSAATAGPSACGGGGRGGGRAPGRGASGSAAPWRCRTPAPRQPSRSLRRRPRLQDAEDALPLRLDPRGAAALPVRPHMAAFAETPHPLRTLAAPSPGRGGGAHAALHHGRYRHAPQVRADRAALPQFRQPAPGRPSFRLPVSPSSFLLRRRAHAASVNDCIAAAATFNPNATRRSTGAAPSPGRKVCDTTRRTSPVCCPKDHRPAFARA